MTQRSWTIRELRGKLDRFEDELRDAGLAEASVRTYVDRSAIFLRWLVGEYTPRESSARRAAAEKTDRAPRNT